MNRWQTALRLMGVGFFIVGSILAGIFAGLWLDRFLQTNLLWLVGLLLGIVFAFWSVYRMLLPLMDNNNKKREN